MKKLILLLSLVALLGCTKAPDANVATDLCIKACQDALSEGMDLSNGPCLSNEIADNWVCDVAHSPRQAIDNDPSNQCPAYGVSASHFVEVDPECNFIRAI